MLFVLFLIFALSPAAHAQSVRVTAQSDGQGFMVKENGTCWVLMPKHLLDAFGGIAVETSPAPSVLGRGRAFADFWGDMDFAIGFVEQAAGGTACTEPLDMILQSGAHAGQQMRGSLRFTEPGGALSQYPMTIVDTSDHKTFVAEFTDPNDQPQQGVSGSFLFAGDRPLGMAIQTPDGARRLTFIRIEEMAFATSQWLVHRARAVTAPTPQAVAVEDGALPLKLEDFNVSALSAETGPENLASGNGAYHFDYTRPVTLTFGVTSGDAVGVSRVKIVSEGEGAKPLSIRVFVDAALTPSPNPIYFARADMTPGGTFDTGPRAEKYARRVIVRIESVQGEGPVRIDRVEVY